MLVVIDVKGQELSLRSQTSQLVEGSKDFIRLHFNFLDTTDDRSWDQFKTWDLTAEEEEETRSLNAIINQEGNISIVTVVDSEAKVPIAISKGFFTVKLKGTNGVSDSEIIGTSNCLELLMNDENTILEYKPEEKNYMRAKQEIKEELTEELSNNLKNDLTDTLVDSLTTTLTSSVRTSIKNELVYSTNVFYTANSVYLPGVGTSSTQLKFLFSPSKLIPVGGNTTVTLGTVSGKILGKDNSITTYSSAPYTTTAEKTANGVLITIKTSTSNGFADYLNKTLMFQISTLSFKFT